jgi:DUF1680 family protein
LAINGQAISPVIEKGYAVLSRRWKAGDTISLTLPTRIQRVRGSDRIEATRDQVALRYGPLIYSFESVDQDLGKVLADDSPLKAEWRSNLLGGVTVIKGTWADGSSLLAVPYYARQNRGGRSTVWVKSQ